MERRVKEHLCRVYDLSLDEVHELFVLAHQTVLDTMARLESSCKTGSAVELGDAAHMLKGALMNMGLTELAVIAKNLETAGAQSRIEDARRLFADLQNKIGL